MKKLWSLLLALVFTCGLILPAVTNHVYASGGVAMTVNGTEYSSHGEGWAQAVRLANGGEKTNIILYADWNAENGNFSYSNGTDKGYLYLNDSDVDLSINLNGHVINRGLTNAVSDGQVFKISGGKLTITDSVGTGRITGGNNTGNGGAFCVENRATLVLEKGKIYDNNAKNGGGIYVCNALFYMNGGSVEKNSAEYGGGISLDGNYSADTEYIVCKGGEISQNTARLGGGVFLDSANEDVVVTFENTQISDNVADDAGGGVYVGFTYEASEVAFGNGTSITRNISDEGGGVYMGCGSIRLIGVHITENRAFTRCGGVGAEDDMDDNAHGTIFEYGTYTLGGDLYIQNNYVQEGWTENPKVNSNLRIGDVTCDLSYDVNNPFTDSASIGIDIYADFGTDEIEEKLTDSKGNFSVDSYEHFTADNPNNIISARDAGSSAGSDRYQIYLQQEENAFRGGIADAVLTSNFDSGIIPVTDKQNKTVTLSVNPKMGRTLENVALFDIVDFIYGDDATGIEEGARIMDLSDNANLRWKVMGKNNSYELWQIKIVPRGGAWSDEDESAARVIFDDKTRYYADLETAWTTAVEASTQKSTILVLNKNWLAGDTDSDGRIDSNETPGAFKYYKDGSEYGTSYGSLYLDELTMDLTIDLNGHTIDRGLTTAREKGHVLYMDIWGSITITDSSEAKTGKITGGNNTGYGGGIYVDYGELRINGGSIVGNKAEYGGGIYCDDLGDATINIKGGKISGNTATENGGGIYVYNGYLYFDGGEISGNTAVEGAGVYWESDDAGCFTGGIVTGNNASSVGDGVYITGDGDVYLGGTIQIVENAGSNLYLSEKSADISNAFGQTDDIPIKPLTDGAMVGITAKNTEDMISADKSEFNEGDFTFMRSDNLGYFIRSVYDADDEEHIHQLYINSWAHDDARYPRITKVNIVNGNILEDASIDYDSQIITLTASVDAKASYKSIPFDRLISCEFNEDGVSIADSNTPRDMRRAQEYKIMSDNGTYVMCIVKVKWLCSEHKDADGDLICDECMEYAFSNTTIGKYNPETKEVTVFVKNPGTYTLIFADYENNNLSNSDKFEYSFKEGINVIEQKDKKFALESGDKVMLWYNMTACTPVCNAFALK